MESRISRNPFAGPLKFYYLSLLAAYLLVPLAFNYMASSFIREGFDPGKTPSETFFIRMFLTAALAAIAVIPLFAMWLHHLLRRAGIRRARLDVFFAAAPIGVPVFCFVLGWLNIVH